MGFYFDLGFKMVITFSDCEYGIRIGGARSSVGNSMSRDGIKSPSADLKPWSPIFGVLF